MPLHLVRKIPAESGEAAFYVYNAESGGDAAEAASWAASSATGGGVTVFLSGFGGLRDFLAASFAAFLAAFASWSKEEVE